MKKLIEFTSKSWNTHAIIIQYKRSKFKILFDDLTEDNQKLLESHSMEEFNISGFCYLEKMEILPSSLHFNFNNYGIPIKLVNHQMIPTKYIQYRYYDDGMYRDINIQKNGFLVYCAPTGQGKTYFAIDNLEKLSRQFETMLYINFELSIDDIYNRCIDHGITIPDNLYISPLESVEVIQEWVADKGDCCFIIDNIDNLVGSGQDAYGLQLEYIKALDRFCKDYGHHALVLTQLVKDSNVNYFGKDGQISSGITSNILSGVKQLSYLSRSVMMTAYSPELNQYVYKVLKIGSAKI